MNDKYSDAQLRKKYGMRRTDAVGIDYPQELGYRCSLGHADLAWSEFTHCIWCYKCKKDYFYADCLLVKDECNPKNLPKQPRIITGISNWTKDGNGFLNIPKRLLRRNDEKSSKEERMR